MIDAQFSPCRKYRYVLPRRLSMDVRRICMFVMLNPSTADETQDDPTIRRCIGYAKTWGYDGLYVGNLYGWRSTDPQGLWTAENPVGFHNDFWLNVMAQQSDIVVCAWGANAKPSRAAEVRALLDGFADLRFLKLTKAGIPGHPLYLKSNLQPQAWTHQ